MKRALLFALFIILSVLKADTIFLTDGSEYKCTLLSMDEKIITVRFTDGVRTFPKESVLNIIIDEKRRFHDIDSINDINDRDILDAFNMNISKEKYPDDNFLCLLNKVIIDNSKEMPIIVRTQIYKILTQEGIEAASSHSYPYLKNSETLSLEYAISISPDGRVDSIYENLIEDEAMNSVSIYVNTHNLKLSVPHVSSDHIVAIQTRRTFEKDPIEAPFYLEEEFMGYYPIIRSEIEIIEPKELKYSVVNRKGIRITRKKNRIFIKSKKKNSIPDNTLVPPGKLFVPRIIIYQPIDEKKYSAEVMKRFNSYSRTGIYDMLGGINFDEIQGDDMIRKIYDHIQNYFVHVDIDPFYSFIYPKDPAAVLRTRSASALDKAFIAKAMFDVRNMDSTVIIAGSYLDEMKKKSGFTPNRFCGAILKVKGLNGDIYLYFGSKTNPFGVIPYNTYSQRYYDIFNERYGNLPDIDLDDTRFQNKIKLISEIRGDGTLTGELVISYEMQNDSYIREFRFKKEEQVRIIIQNILNSFIQGANIIEYSLKNLDISYEQTVLKIKFSRSDYAQFAGHNMLFGIPIIEYQGYDFGSNIRKIPVFIGERSFTRYIIQISVPKDFNIVYSPANVSFNNRYININSIINNNINDLTINHMEYYKKEMAPRGFYFRYKRAMRDLIRFVNTVIICEKGQD